jgi:DNA-binding CsgD family transcriptional regulator
MRPPARELEILLAVAEGKSLRQIAKSFMTSEVAVRESLVKTRERYRAPNNESAIARALDQDHLTVPLIRRQICLEDDERELLGCIAEGYDDRRLMAKFHASRTNIDHRVDRVLQKLKAANRCHGVYLGFGHNLIVLGARTPAARRGRVSEIRAIEAIVTSTDLEEAAQSLGVEYNTAKSYLQRSRRRHHARTTPHLVSLAIRSNELSCTKKSPTTVRSLTAQEIKALALMADGLHDPEIAIKLDISQRKAGPLINGAVRKLGANSRAHAVLILFQQRVLR